MKTLRISDDVHQKLTTLLGELMAQTRKMQTYQDAIEAMLSQSVILPPELLKEVESFIEKNKRLGYTTREEFVRDAIRFKLDWLNEKYEYIEIPKKEYEKLSRAIEVLGLPARNGAEYIHDIIDGVLKEYDFQLQHVMDKKRRKEEEEYLEEIEELWGDKE
jgi:Arc/MetJ-type ribon-helix-helix transcriptional regulator